MKKTLKRFAVVALALCFAAVLLAGCGSGKKDQQTKAYICIAVDEENAPVEGVSLQLCSDTACVMQKTDETGTTEFAVDEGKYTLHVLDVPEGFAGDETEYPVPETYGLVTVVLKHAE